jgi:large subunit ribosomal protein L18
MATKKRHTIAYRRKRKGFTNYKKRLRLLQSGRPRLVVRRGNKTILAQIIEYKASGDVILSSANSAELRKFGWKYSTANTPAAYLTGLLIGKKASAKKVENAVLDIGLYPPTKGSKIFAALKGAIDAGLKVPCSEEIFPDEKRIKGNHVVDYAKKIKEDKKQYDKKFSGYAKNGADPEEMSAAFDEVKSKIMKG